MFAEEGPQAAAERPKERLTPRAPLRNCEFRPTLFGLPFTCPEGAVVDGISLASVITAISAGDAVALASIRQRSTDACAFDGLVATVRSVGARDYAAATRACADIAVPRWRVPASVFCALAAAASGDLRTALALANQVMSAAVPFGRLDSRCGADHAIIGAGIRCLAEMEKEYSRPGVLADIQAPFWYLVSYPRSGATMLRRFLSFVFEAPVYSVYPGDGRYFSRYLHDANDHHAVFVKTHEWREEYADENVLAIVRDGRNASLSYARFLYADGYHSFVGAGELADFLRFVAEKGIGFWGSHVQQILAARAQGARIRIVRYEDLFENYSGLYAVARSVAGGCQMPRDDEAGWDALVARLKTLPGGGGWSKQLALPEHSYLPSNWSLGGGTIDWRRAFDPAARRTFHELGGTEVLKTLGYETDPDWWRKG